MKKHLFLGGAAALLSLTLITCQDSYEWSPTYAVPLASGSLGVADVISARPNDVESETTDEGLVTYELNYTDTLDEIPAASFGLGNTYTIPEQKVFLRMFGKSQDGYFHFTDPTVEFSFLNTVDADFDVTFDDLYTQNVTTNDVFNFNISGGTPHLQIPSGSEANPGVGLLFLNNSNTTSTEGDSALTSVFSPTPKYLYYTPKITPTSGGISQGTLMPIANVNLPMEGYGRVTRYDTIFYSFKDSLFSVGGDDEMFEASAGLGDFGLLRMNFTNGIPLEVTVSGQIFSDSTDFGPDNNFVANLPFYDEADNPLTTAMVVQGAEQNSFTSEPTTTPVKATTEVRIERENSAAGLANLSDFEDGQVIIIRLDFNTTGENNDETIQIFDDQTLDFNMGIRVNGEAQFRRPKLKDLLNGDDED